MAFLIFLFAIVASEGFSADSSNAASASDALATSDGQLVSQTMAADARGTSSGSLENPGLEMVTNRKKVLSESSTLADLTNEDVVSPPQKRVLVIQSANSESASASSQSGTETAKKCVPQIGLTYADSTPCPIKNQENHIG